MREKINKRCIIGLIITFILSIIERLFVLKAFEYTFVIFFLVILSLYLSNNFFSNIVKE